MLKIRSLEKVLRILEELLRILQDSVRIIEEFFKNSSGILEELFKNFQGGEIDNCRDRKVVISFKFIKKKITILVI